MYHKLPEAVVQRYEVRIPVTAVITMDAHDPASTLQRLTALGNNLYASASQYGAINGITIRVNNDTFNDPKVTRIETPKPNKRSRLKGAVLDICPNCRALDKDCTCPVEITNRHTAGILAQLERLRNQ